MRAVILAGGRGSRMAGTVPKPLVPIAGRALILHVIDQFRGQGITDILVATGHRGSEVATALDGHGVTMVDTGAETANGGRLWALRDRLPDTFLLAWTDGLWDIDLTVMIATHHRAGRPLTMALAHPHSTYGVARVEGDRVASIAEKPLMRDVWVGAGLFVVEPEVVADISAPDTSWEQDVLPALVARGAVTAWGHDGFWRGVDTPADAEAMTRLAAPGPAPWARQ